MAGAIIVLFVILAVSYQSIRLVRVNPVEPKKEEMGELQIVSNGLLPAFMILWSGRSLNAEPKSLCDSSFLCFPTFAQQKLARLENKKPNVLPHWVRHS